MANDLGLTVKPVSTTSPEEEARVSAWIDSPEYRERNFARQALVINPAHGCQPLGAELCAHGFEGTLPFTHGSQGCASYYRSTLNRHFREPAPAVSDAMTEDGAVFGGQNNLHEGLENAVALYKPDHDRGLHLLHARGDRRRPVGLHQERAPEGVPARDLPVPYANTPSFSGTHVTGYDAMLLSILQTLTEGKKIEGRCTGKLNLIAGFDANTGNYREYKRILDAFGIPFTLLADISDTFDSPNDGTYRLYAGGTPLLEAADSMNGKATLTLAPYATAKTFPWIKENYSGSHASLPMPMGIARTDALLLKLSELFDRPVPDVLKAERGRAVDAMTDAQQYMHGRKFAVYGDGDLILGYVSFLLEMGATPHHVLCSRGSKKLEKELQALLDGSPYGKGAHVWMNRDLWHLRSLLMTDPVDGLIGDTHGKFAARDAKIPLFRFGFPVFDRVNKHRSPIIGYQGAIHMLTEICNKFLDLKDETCEERFFEMMR